MMDESDWNHQIINPYVQIWEIWRATSLLCKKIVFISIWSIWVKKFCSGEHRLMGWAGLIPQMNQSTCPILRKLTSQGVIIPYMVKNNEN